MDQTAGRPKAQIDEEEIYRLVELGYNNTEIANRIGINRKTVFRWMKKNNYQRPGNNDFTDEELDREVQ